MPKLKTNKAMKKRFKITKSGKVLAPRSLRRHLLTDKTPKKKRQARRPLEVAACHIKAIKLGLPYS